MKVLITFLLLFMSYSVWACSCSSPSLVDRVENSKQIVIGTVISIRDLKYVSVAEQKYPTGIEAVILVEETLKGESTERLFLYSSYNSNDCGMDFAIGSIYIYFLNGARVGSCTGHVSKDRFNIKNYNESLKEVRRLIDNGLTIKR